MKSNLLQRSITGLLFVVVLVGAIWFSPISFAILFLLITGLSVREFARLVNAVPGVQINVFINMLGGGVLFLSTMGFCTEVYSSGIFIPYLLVLLYLFISELYLKKENPMLNWAYSTMSQLYVALPFALLNVLAFQADPLTSSVSYNPVLPLSVFIFIWLNDSGAYCFGSLFGKHRLFERISPKKSWEGSVGGGLVALASSFVLAHFFPGIMDISQWLGLALVVIVFATWGDLTESLLKRQLGIKDSGNILPGHGGMLDRFDSVLMAVPAAVVYLYALAVFA